MASAESRSVKIKNLLIIFLIFVFIITLRLFYLQVHQRLLFGSLGERNFLRTEIILPPRGNLLDCKNMLLAANRPVFNLHWQGLGAPKLSESDYELIKKIESILNTTFDGQDFFKTLAVGEKYSRRTLLKEDIGFEQLCQICEQCADCSRLMVENRFKRVYPHQSLASHVLGYLSRAENVGKSGVESLFQDELQGETGYIMNVINSTGKRLEQKDSKDPKAGVDISLTLDFKLQALAEKMFEKDQSGAMIIMDPETGSLRALVSYPNFDPNLFLNPISEDVWNDKLVPNNPLLNRATCSSYPPASIFKLVTWAAGLEEKVIDTTTEFMCNGFVEFCGRKYYCMRHSGHGKLLPKEALAVSCNVPCFQLGRRLKIDKIADYAQRFGLGRKTNMLLPERSGLVPTSTWKLAVRGERWWKGETLSTTIGQGYLLATPMQIARMISSICTGYLIKPRILEQEEIEKEPLQIAPETLRFLREGMREVVNAGSLRVLSGISGFTVAAKTGTAQTCSLSKEKIDKRDLEHAWVAGYFSYQGRKPLTIIVMVENAGSSRPAILIAHRFLQEYRKYMQEHDG
jgi:penicillin-binding protein 2